MLVHIIKMTDGCDLQLRTVIIAEIVELYSLFWYKIIPFNKDRGRGKNLYMYFYV